MIDREQRVLELRTRIRDELNLTRQLPLSPEMTRLFDLLADCKFLLASPPAATNEPCSVCGGSGKPASGLPCVCDGKGTMWAELEGTRRELFNLHVKLGHYPALGQTHELIAVEELRALRVPAAPPTEPSEAVMQKIMDEAFAVRELRPCPFCGDAESVWIEGPTLDGEYEAGCHRCFISATSPLRKAAAHRWNSRRLEIVNQPAAPTNTNLAPLVELMRAPALAYDLIGDAISHIEHGMNEPGMTLALLKRAQSMLRRKPAASELENALDDPPPAAPTSGKVRLPGTHPADWPEDAGHENSDYQCSCTPCGPCPTCRASTDAGHENGDYQCTCTPCGIMFYGQSGRVVCRVCALGLAAPTTRPDPEYERLALTMDAEAERFEFTARRCRSMPDADSQAMAETRARRAEGYRAIAAVLRSRTPAATRPDLTAEDVSEARYAFDTDDAKRKRWNNTPPAERPNYSKLRDEFVADFLNQRLHTHPPKESR